MSEALDYPVGEYPGVDILLGLGESIEQVKNDALKGFRELAAERDKAIQERDAARAERDDLRANVAWLSGRL